MSACAWASGRLTVVVMRECVLSGQSRLGMRCTKTREPGKKKTMAVCAFSLFTPTCSPGGPNLFSRPHSLTGDRHGASKFPTAQHRNVIFMSPHLYN